MDKAMKAKSKRCDGKLLFLSILVYLWLLTPAVDGAGGLGEAVSWEADCDNYATTASREYNTVALTTVSGSSLQLCRSNCTSNTRCGSFTLTTSNYCRTHDLSDDIIDSNLDSGWYDDRDDSVTAYSKTCPYTIEASGATCNIYDGTIYHETYIQIHYMISYTFEPKESGLTLEACQAWCTIYPACRSLSYGSNGPGYDCYLHTTVVADLIADDKAADVVPHPTYDTYERFCPGNVPYVQGAAPLATTAASIISSDNNAIYSCEGTKEQVVRGAYLLGSPQTPLPRVRCAVRCLLHQQNCVGFNYNAQSQTCELLSVNGVSHPELLEPQQGYDHYALI